MFTLILLVLDVIVVSSIVLGIVRLVRVLSMRTKCITNLKSVCKKRGYELKIHHSPFLSLFFKWHKTDISIRTAEKTYKVKFLTFFSSKKVCHFVDENSYVCYLKSFFALPLATKVSEHINTVSYHRLPTLTASQNEDEVFILLCNPTPNEITYIEKDGSRQVADNGSKIGSLLVYNAKGLCALLDGI